MTTAREKIHQLIEKFHQEQSAGVIKITPENPVLWTGMKGVSANGRKKT